jgi:hypothetical protein
MLYIYIYIYIYNIICYIHNTIGQDEHPNVDSKVLKPATTATRQIGIVVLGKAKKLLTEEATLVSMRKDGEGTPMLGRSYRLDVAFDRPRISNTASLRAA